MEHSKKMIDSCRKTSHLKSQKKLPWSRKRPDQQRLTSASSEVPQKHQSCGREGLGRTSPDV